jgi:1-acyl-sn-glycerol-3-phosphate acyltransferase
MVSASGPHINPRFLYASLHALMATGLLGSTAILGACLRVPLTWLETISWLWAHWILSGAGIRVKVIGLEHLPKEPVVMIGNHQGLLDILALIQNLPRPPVFVAKKELFSLPIFGPALHFLGHIPIDRKDSVKAIQSIQNGTVKLKQNQQQIVFFPEGTRTRDGSLGEFKKGAFVFALESHLPLVPFVIRGSYEALPPGKKIVRSGWIEVEFLKPVDTHSYTPADKDRLRADIKALIGARLKD